MRDRAVRSRRWFHFLRLREIGMRIRHAGANLVVPLAVAGLMTVAAVYGLGSVWNSASASRAVSVVTPLIALLGPAWPVSRLLLRDSARGARHFERSHKDPMGELAHDFAWLLRRSSTARRRCSS